MCTLFEKISDMRVLRTRICLYSTSICTTPYSGPRPWATVRGARLPTARDEELGCLLSRTGLRAQELQQFGVDFLCMGPRNAVRTTLDDHQTRARD